MTHPAQQSVMVRVSCLNLPSILRDRHIREHSPVLVLGGVPERLAEWFLEVRLCSLDLADRLQSR